MSSPLTGELANLMAMLNDPSNVIVAHLAKNNMSAYADSVVLADFVECDFPGYAPVVISNCIPQVSASERYGAAFSQPLVFLADGLTVPQQISAIYVTITSGVTAPTLLMVDIFPVPILIKASGESFPYEVMFERALLPGE